MVDAPGPSAGAMLVMLAFLGGCKGERADQGQAPNASATVTLAAELAEPQPEILYLPDGGDVAPPTPVRAIAPVPPQPGQRGTRCPPEMVEVDASYCVDRYEAVLTDAQGRRLSPYYTPRRYDTKLAYDRYRQLRSDASNKLGRSLPIPEPPDWQLREEFTPHAVVLAGETPNGYLSGVLARSACENAGKRLCTQKEWVRACRGQQDRQFPYGAAYEEGVCNVARMGHPAQMLHNDASIHHHDPRLNTVTLEGDPLLRPAGSMARCRSEWGGDAIYDMVGNLDEWVDDDRGMFLGGFFSRPTKDGCFARITAHPPRYSDYSLGVRCCLTPSR